MEVHHMKGGEDEASYAQNSLLQKMVILKMKHIVEESIRELCLSSLPECISVADLGCASGPNAFLPTQEIIENVTKVCHELNLKPPSVQVFLNDLVVNDFNTLFKSLPSFYARFENLEGGSRKPKSCFVAAVPGSFYGRLFPDQSIHYVHSSYSLHWISKVPTGLVNESGEPLNKRNICMAKTSPTGVHEAYLDQFKEDFTMFIRIRSQDMALQGHMNLAFMCKNDENDGYDISEFFGMAIDDMVKEGLIEEKKLATFNLPYYAPSLEEITQIIESEGSFVLRRLETFKLPWDANMAGRKREENLALAARSIAEPMLARHFGKDVLDELFHKFGKKASKYMETGKGILNTVLMSLAKENKN